MKVEEPRGQRSVSTQPADTLLTDTDVGRIEVDITANTAGPWYIKRGLAAAADNWCFKLIADGHQIGITNYQGPITVFPEPTAGQINVSVLKPV